MSSITAIFRSIEEMPIIYLFISLLLLLLLLLLHDNLQWYNCFLLLFLQNKNQDFRRRCRCCSNRPFMFQFDSILSVNFLKIAVIPRSDTCYHLTTTALTFEPPLPPPFAHCASLRLNQRREVSGKGKRFILFFF